MPAPLASGAIRTTLARNPALSAQVRALPRPKSLRRVALSVGAIIWLQYHFQSLSPGFSIAGKHLLLLHVIHVDDRAAATEERHMQCRVTLWCACPHPHELPTRAVPGAPSGVGVQHLLDVQGPAKTTALCEHGAQRASALKAPRICIYTLVSAGKTDGVTPYIMLD